MKPIVRVFRYLRFFPKEIVGNIFFNVLAIFFNLFSFVMIIPFVELIFGATRAPEMKPEFALDQQTMTDWLMWTLAQLKVQWGAWKCMFVVLGGYVSCVLLSNLNRFLGLYFLSTIRNGVICRLRDDLYARITILPLSYFSASRRGDIVSRCSNDLADIEWSVVSTLQSLIKDPINVLVFAATLIFVSPQLFLYFLLILPVVVFIISKVGKSLKRNSVEGQRKLGGLFSVFEESVNGLLEIRDFGIERQRQKLFDGANQDYMRTMRRVISRRELSSPMSEVLGTVGLVAILVIGGMMVFGGQIASSVFIFFIIIFARLIPPVQAVVKAYNSLLKGSASAARVFEVIDADEVIEQPDNAIVHEHLEHEIAYSHLSFSYASEEGSMVLDDINLVIPKGKTVAVVGPSGAGKSTLVDLLPRFFDPTSGDLLLDGHPLRTLDIPALRGVFGIVSQNCILLDDTIAANIAFGQEQYSMERVREAARLANAEEFIMQQPDGFDTVVGDRGLCLSGGQRQRISIARALFRNPEVLILDEATSALDSESEMLVQQSLNKLMENRTCIVVAHRLSTIQHANQIVVMEAGKIVQRGTHFSLLAEGGLYKKLVEMQSFDS